MALTGLALMGFVLIHMLGNLQVFAGAEALNSYSHALEDLGPLLWVARIGLLVTFFLHLYLAIVLTKENRSARPVQYRYKDTIKATLTSRTMILSGLVILAYIIYHLMHFTFRTADPSLANLKDISGHHDVYRMVILGFSNLYVSLTYLVALVFLAAHLHHGASSVVQTLGLNCPKWKKFTRFIGPVIATIVLVGYGSIPIAVLTGCIK